MNKQELREWILPENYDHAKAEAAHLIYESDVDSVSLCVGVGGCGVDRWVWVWMGGWSRSGCGWVGGVGRGVDVCVWGV